MSEQSPGVVEFGKNKEPQVLEINERQIGGVRVVYVGVEHREDPASYPWEEIRKLIQDSDKVVEEYCIPELEETFLQNPVTGDFIRSQLTATGIIPFSSGVEKIAAENQKDILVMDPAAYPSYVAYYAGVAAPAGIGLSNLLNLAQEQLNSHTKMPRRKFFKHMAINAGITAASLEAVVGLNPKDFPKGGKTVSLRDMRRVTVAAGLEQYGKTNEGEKLVLFYPKAHINDGLLYYADHPNLLSVKNRIYSVFPGDTRQIREFSAKGGNGIWRKTNSTKIS